MSHRFSATLAGLLFATGALAGSLTANSDRMDQVARYYNKQFMGSVLVARGDEVLFSKAYGSANLAVVLPPEPFAKRTELEEVHIDVGSSGALLIVTAHVEDYRAAPLDLLAPATTRDSSMTRFMKTYNEVAKAGDIKKFVSLFAPDVGAAEEDIHHTPQSLREQFADLRSVRLSAVLHWGDLQVGFVQYEAADGEGGTRRWTASHPARCSDNSCQIAGHFENGLLGRIVTNAFANKGGAQVATPSHSERLPILPATKDASQKAATSHPIVLHLNRSSEETRQAASTIVSTLTNKLSATIDSVYSLGPDVCVALLRSSKDRALHLLPLQRAATGWTVISDPSSLDAWTVLSSTSTYQALQNRSGLTQWP